MGFLIITEASRAILSWTTHSPHWPSPETSPLDDQAPANPSAKGWPPPAAPLKKHESGHLRSLRDNQDGLGV